MSVNDLIVQGAKPLFFLDYISINKIDLKKLKSIMKGILNGCKISNCELVGGETAEMPGTYEKGKFDIAGFAVGIVDEKKILKKKKIKKPNIIAPVIGWSTSYYPICQNGFEINFVDVDLNTLNICPNEVEKAIDKNTVGILAINLLGNPCNFKKLQEISNQFNKLKLLQMLLKKFLKIKNIRY